MSFSLVRTLVIIFLLTGHQVYGEVESSENEIVTLLGSTVSIGSGLILLSGGPFVQGEWRYSLNLDQPLSEAMKRSLLGTDVSFFPTGTIPTHDGERLRTLRTMDDVNDFDRRRLSFLRNHNVPFDNVFIQTRGIYRANTLGAILFAAGGAWIGLDSFMDADSDNGENEWVEFEDVDFESID